MKRLISFLLFSIIATSLISAKNYEERSCEWHGRRLSLGEHTMQCMKVTCHPNGTVNVERCPVIYVSCLAGSSAVTVPGNTNEPYPGCCPRKICVPYE